MDAAGAAGPLAEYASLRTEIDTRAKYQQQILALQLTLSSAIVAFALSRPNFVALLLVVPVSSYVLCGRYVAQQTAIRWISTYIRDALDARVPGGLGWVAWSGANRRPDRLVDWLVPMLLVFPGASAFALGWTFPLAFYRSGVAVPARIGFVALWLAGAFGALVTARMLVRIFATTPTAPPQP